MAFKDDSIMPFGQHKGKQMADVPASYLIYLYENRKVYGDLRIYIEDNMTVLREQIKQEQNKRK